MLATSDRRQALPIALAASMLALLGGVAPLQAHPMPDTEIVVARGTQVLNLVIRVPMTDLLLALPPRVPRDAQVLLRRNQPELRAYFAAHTHLSTRRGGTAPVTIGSIRLNRERNAQVGSYSELKVSASARVGASVPLSLAYDGVLHRIANHRVLVRDGAGRPIGVIRYSLAAKAAAPLALPIK